MKSDKQTNKPDFTLDGHRLEERDFAACERQRRRLGGASTQSGMLLLYTFKIFEKLCSCTDKFESYFGKYR